MPLTPTFSEEEMALMRDPEVMLAKVRIIKNITTLLDKLGPELQSVLLENRSSFPDSTIIREGKISRGENYLNLPYVILDYPRISGNQSLFFYRTMFWWGNFFSCTLHLQGYWLQYNLQSFLDKYPSLFGRNYFFCIKATPWDYHFDVNNYTELENLNPQDIEKHANDNSFIKVSRKLDLQKWESLGAFSVQTFTELLSIIK